MLSRQSIVPPGDSFPVVKLCIKIMVSTLSTIS
jgi:hypothetical protein